MCRLRPSGERIGQPSLNAVLSDGSDPTSALTGALQSPNVSDADRTLALDPQLRGIFGLRGILQAGECR